MIVLIIQSKCVPEYLEVCDICSSLRVRPFCLHQFCTAANTLNPALAERKNGKGWKERKTKAIDINDLPARRGPQAGASEGPLDTN